MKNWNLILCVVFLVPLLMANPTRAEDRTGRAPVQSKAQCDASKQKEFGKFFFGVMKAYSKAAKKGLAVDLSREQAKFQKQVIKLTAKCGAYADDTLLVHAQSALENLGEALAEASEQGVPLLGPEPEGLKLEPIPVGHSVPVETEVGTFTVEYSRIDVSVNPRFGKGEVHDVGIEYVATVNGTPRTIRYTLLFAEEPYAGMVATSMRVVEGEGEQAVPLIEEYRRFASDSLPSGSLRVNGQPCETVAGYFQDPDSELPQRGALRHFCGQNNSADPLAIALISSRPLDSPEIGLEAIAAQHEPPPQGARAAAPCGVFVLAALKFYTDAPISKWLKDCRTRTRTVQVCQGGNGGGAGSPSIWNVASEDCNTPLCGTVCCDDGVCVEETEEYQYYPD